MYELTSRHHLVFRSTWRGWTILTAHRGVYVYTISSAVISFSSIVREDDMKYIKRHTCSSKDSLDYLWILLCFCVGEVCRYLLHSEISTSNFVTPFLSKNELEIFKKVYSKVKELS